MLSAHDVIGLTLKFKLYVVALKINLNFLLCFFFFTCLKDFEEIVHCAKQVVF